MTIQEFINECTQVMEKTQVLPSDNDSYVRSCIAAPIVEHFKNKGIEIKRFTYTDTEIGFKEDHKITMPDDTKVDVNIELVFGTVIKKTGNIIPITKTISKYEKTVGDTPVKFKRADVYCRIPSYEMKNGKVTRENGFYVGERAILKGKITASDDVASILKKIDISKVEEELNSSICQPVLKGVMIFHKNIPGVDQFLNYTTNEIDMKGLADFIRKNMM